MKHLLGTGVSIAVLALTGGMALAADCDVSAGNVAILSNDFEALRVLALARALVAEEVENLVLLDRPADGPAELVRDELRLRGVAVGEERVGQHVLVGVVLEG